MAVKNAPDEGERINKHQADAIVEEFFDTATMHGLGKINSSSTRLSRICWMIIFLTVFTSLVFNIVQTAFKLGNHEIMLKTRNVRHHMMSFPGVTFCNTNPFRMSRIHDYIKRNGPVNNMTRSDYRKSWLQFVTRTNATDKYSDGHLIEDFIVLGEPEHPLCTFGGERCNLQTYFTVKTTVFGNCYTFNANRNFKQASPGNEGGFRVTININQSEYDPFTSWWSSSAGVVIAFDADNLVPLQSEQLIYASPGQLTRIGLRKSTINRLPNPYPDNCTTGEKLKSNFLFPGEYSGPACSSSCYLRYVLKFCKALDPVTYQALQDISNDAKRNMRVPISTNTSCQIHVNRMFKRGELNCECPPSCTEVIYSTTISTAKWPSKAAAKTLAAFHNTGYNSNATTDDIYENYLTLEVFFEDFSVNESIQLPAYDLNSFFSDLGGQLGLWIGASVFSLFEIIALVAELISAKLSPKQLNSESQPLSDL